MSLSNYDLEILINPFYKPSSTLRDEAKIRVQILRGIKRDNNWNADYTDDADLRG